MAPGERRQFAAPAVPAGVEIDTPEQAAALAGHLLDPRRQRPAVVVTIPAGREAPYICVGDLVDAVNGMADVYLLPTGQVTIALSDRLPPLTQVYGGAGRVYPTTNRWHADPYAAPLRFAYGDGQGRAATDLLIADALAAAHAAGLAAAPAKSTPRPVAGTVVGLVEPSRALVAVDDGSLATIWLELLIPGLTLGQVFTVGMPVRGLLDREQRRIEVSGSRRRTGEAVSSYHAGDVVLASVVELDNVAAVVELFPGVKAELSAREVTGNPLDRLQTLLSPGEVVRLRVTERGRPDGRGWRLSMLDVEDSDLTVPPPSVLPEGPAWLTIEPAAPTRRTGEEEPATAEPPWEWSSASDSPADAPATAVIDHVSSAEDSQGDSSSTRVVGAQEVSARLAALEGQLQEVKRAVEAMTVERDAWRQQASEAHSRVRQLEVLERSARTSLREAKVRAQKLEKQLRSARAEVGSISDSGLFLDQEEQFRFEVDCAWARRIPAADKGRRGRRPYTLGPSFLESLRDVEGVERAKVVDVTVEILTDLVNEINGRELHPLRDDSGPHARDVVRQDGAKCMRAALQKGTPSARRIHFWRLGDAIELSRVVVHDDMTP